MSDDPKTHLHTYLTRTREAVLWKASGLSEYDVRRPMTPTGTNVLGLVKHLTMSEVWYLGAAFDRPFVPHLPWWDDDAPENADLLADASESREQILQTYRDAIAHADATVGALDLNASGHVPWWPSPDVTLHGVLVHVLTETARHAGHVDILREQIDGRAGMSEHNPNHEAREAGWWSGYRAKVEALARSVNDD